MDRRYDLGCEVRLLCDIYDDGTYPGASRGELLVSRGATGFIRDFGYFLQEQLIYTVHFLDADIQIGCREHELQPVSEKFLPSRFRLHDVVRLKVPVVVNGETLAEEGSSFNVSRVMPGDDRIDYHIRIADKIFRVPELALEPALEAVV